MAPPETHGHNTIYLDPSITFENYHWWANRSREAEKHISTNAGLKQIFIVIFGKKITDEKLSPTEITQDGQELQDRTVQDEKTPPNVDSASDSNERRGTGLNSDDGTAAKKDRWGVAESDWEAAQRATRTATWGEYFLFYVGHSSLTRRCRIGLLSDDNRHPGSVQCAVGLRGRWEMRRASSCLCVVLTG